MPKADGGNEPLPEGIFYLLLTGEIPTKEQVDAISREWAARAELPQHVVMMLNNFPEDVHPMTQFVTAIAALNKDSKFAKAYSDGVSKQDYWIVRFEFQIVFLLSDCFLALYRGAQDTEILTML